jgi:hypothetical protein
MPVDYQQIFERVREIGAGMGARQETVKKRRDTARDLLKEYAGQPDFLRLKVEKANAADAGIRCALPVRESLTSAFPLPSVFPEATLIAADGSQINPDRHAALQYAVVNVGAVVMKLNSGQVPDVHTQTELFYGDELQEHKLTSEGAVSLRRDLNERIFVEKLTQGLDGFVINLTDGTIEIWARRTSRTPVHTSVLCSNISASYPGCSRGGSPPPVTWTSPPRTWSSACWRSPRLRTKNWRRSATTTRCAA